MFKTKQHAVTIMQIEPLNRQSLTNFTFIYNLKSDISKFLYEMTFKEPTSSVQNLQICPALTSSAASVKVRPFSSSTMSSTYERNHSPCRREDFCWLKSIAKKYDKQWLTKHNKYWDDVTFWLSHLSFVLQKKGWLTVRNADVFEKQWLIMIDSISHNYD